MKLENILLYAASITIGFIPMLIELIMYKEFSLLSVVLLILLQFLAAFIHISPKINEKEIIQPKPLSKYWVCVNMYGEVLYFTIAPFESWSIREFLKGTEMDWDEAKSYGNKCVKVDVSFNLCT